MNRLQRWIAPGALLAGAAMGAAAQSDAAAAKQAFDDARQVASRNPNA